MRPPDGVSSRYAALRHEVGPRTATSPRNETAHPERVRCTVGGALACDGRCRQRERERPSTRLDLDPNLRPGGR